MDAIARKKGRWRNYHRNIERSVDDWRALRGESADPAQWRGWCVAAAALLKQQVEAARIAGRPLLPVGAAWSFSRLAEPAGALLETQGLPAIFDMTAADLAPGVDPRLHVLCAGGTRIRELNRFLESSRRSLFTSGAHDGQSVAGCCATGVHGSVLRYGPFSNHVRGIHLVTAGDRSVWIEPGPQLRLRDAAAIADEVICDPDIFAAALIHLGGMGVVNAMLLEVSDEYRVEAIRRRHPLERGHFALLAEGRFDDFCQAIGEPADPYYLEITFNPFAPWAGYAGQPAYPAAITLYRRVDPDQEAMFLPFGRVVDDILNVLSQALDKVSDAFIPPRKAAELVLSQMKERPAPGEPPAYLRWGEANGKHDPQKLGPVAVNIHNDAFAVERHRLLDALDHMLDAFAQDGGGHLVSTLRFVDLADGLLPFTAFPANAVFNWDGQRTHASRNAGRRMALALETAEIPFAQHWGKMGLITPERIESVFGAPGDPTGRLARWKAARARLITPALRPVLTNPALADWALD